MPDFYSGTVILVGDRGGWPGNRAPCNLHDILWDWYALEGWRDFVDSYSLANTVSIYGTGERVNSSWSKPGAGVNMDRLAVLYFRWVERGTSFPISVPAFDPAYVIDTPAGKRVSPVAMQAFADAITLYTSRTANPIYGYIIQRQ